MNRAFDKRIVAATCLAILGISLAAASPTMAGTPSPENSIVQWFQSVWGGLIFICPAPDCTGWKTYLDVTVLDGSGAPVAGEPVSLVFSDPDVCTPGVAGSTDGSGYVRLNIVGGLQGGNGDSPAVYSGYTVYAGWGGVVISTGNTYIVSPGLNCDSGVDAIDYSAFSLGWLKYGAIRANLDGSGYVEALDFSAFARHWLHGYPGN